MQLSNKLEFLELATLCQNTTVTNKGQNLLLEQK